MKSYESQSYSRFSVNQATIDGKLNLQELLKGVVEEVISTLDVRGCRAEIFKEENRGSEATASDGSFQGILKAQHGWSAVHQAEIRANQRSKAAPFIPIPICWKDRVRGLLLIYPPHHKPLTPDEIRWLHSLAGSLAASIPGIQRYAATLEKGRDIDE